MRLDSGQRKRILLTGCTGMIGANLAHRLVAARHQVFVLIRESSNLVRLQSLVGRIQILVADVTDATAVRDAVQQVDPEVVYHLASTPFNPATISARTHMQVIMMGTLNVMDAIMGCPGVRVIYTGSAAEYGGGSQLREDSPLLPGTILGAAKASASILMQTYARLYQMETVVLRLFTPYGSWEHPRRLIPYTILSALDGRDVSISQGKQQRDYCYIDDVVDALILAGTRSVPSGAVFNICSGQGIPIRDVVELTLELMGNPVKALVGVLPTRPDEIWEMSGDITAAHEVLGWEPHTSLEDGLRKTIAWFTENRELVCGLT